MREAKNNRYVKSMDYCIFCGSTVSELFCSRCTLIYLFERANEMYCHNCFRKEFTHFSKHRSMCNFCGYHYFFTKGYRSFNFDEIMRGVELQCSECQSRVVFQEISKELVCINCGLVSDDVIGIENDRLFSISKERANFIR